MTTEHTHDYIEYRNMSGELILSICTCGYVPFDRTPWPLNEAEELNTIDWELGRDVPQPRWIRALLEFDC